MLSALLTQLHIFSASDLNSASEFEKQDAKKGKNRMTK
jgi:hypothetical protein